MLKVHYKRSIHSRVPASGQGHEGPLLCKLSTTPGPDPRTCGAGEAGEAVKVGNCLLCKHKGPSSIPQPPRENVGCGSACQKSQHWEADRGVSLGLTGSWGRPRLHERFCLKELNGKSNRRQECGSLIFTCMQTHTHTHTHTWLCHHLSADAAATGRERGLPGFREKQLGGSPLFQHWEGQFFQKDFSFICVLVHHLCAEELGGRSGVSDPLKLEFQVVLSHLRGGGSRN